jgi:post-segregation antitoxin (ccd killing protein)
LEGQLFRTALEDELREQNLPYKVFVEKDAFSAASALLQVSAAKAKSVIASLGDSQEGAWRAEEKLAALAAWVALR